MKQPLPGVRTQWREPTKLNDPSRGTWCQTITGGISYPYDPRPEDIDVRDLRALANVCRFGGHVRGDLYSVAEHLWRCAARAEHLGHSAEEKWSALVHDAHEAYGLGDVLGPMKWSHRLPSPMWKAIAVALDDVEALHMYAVRMALKAPQQMPKSVQVIDLELLATERRDVMVESSVDWGVLPPPLSERIIPQSPVRAWIAFVDSWNRLKPEGVPSL